MSTLVDAPARERARIDLGSSLLVEASAGTGKTTTLISRILALVLEEGVPLSRIVALTFTERAASEMRVRLEAALDGERGGSGERAGRAAAAHLALAGAAIGTLHSFCGQLLRERPVEAGVDPDFTTPDESVGLDLLRERFDEWLLEEGSRDGSATVALLRAGAEPAALRHAAEELYGSRALLSGSRIPADAEAEARSHLGRLAARLREVLRRVPPGLERDPKAVAVRHAAQGLETLAREPLEAMASAGAAARELRIDLRAGARDLWDEEARALLEEAREDLKRLPDFLASLPLQSSLRDFAHALLDDLFARVEEEKRSMGVLDFDDLLLGARRLLRSSPSAREHFRTQHDVLIVDEFQDTDPLQAEIVFRLTAGEPQDQERWDDLVPRPGTLFLVGDPKQSIYRFRGADVETYRSVRDRFPASERLSVSVNFRSDPSILTFVNALSRHLLVERRGEPWQVGDAPLSPPPDTPAGSERVLFLAPPPPEPNASETAGVAPDDDGEPPAELTVAEEEAEAVAALILSRLAAGGGRDRQGDRPFSGIAVLVFRNETVEVFQEVFQRRGIPVVLEGGRGYFRREETAAVLTALRAIDDPGDAVAFVATLKSFLFAFSDLELVEAAEAGARFEDRDTLPSGSLVTEAAALLDRLHAARHERPLAETLLDLLSARLAFVSARHGALASPLQAEANLKRLVSLCRELDREGLSFARALTRLRRRLLDPVAEPRAFAEGEDAVRLSTIHKAKGLEFPTVVVAELARKRPLDGRRDQLIRYDRAGGSWGLALRAGDVRVGTPGHERLQEADALRTEAEARRLLYVALTRARERLVVSWFRRRGRRADGSVTDPLATSVLGPVAFAARERSIVSPLVTWLPEPAAPGQGIPAAPLPAAVSPAAVEPLASLERDLLEHERRLEEVRRAAGRALRRAGEAPAFGEGASTPQRAPPEDAPAEERERRAGAFALEVGIAVHVAMERLLDPMKGGQRPEAGEVDAALLDATAELPHAARAEVGRLVGRLLADDLVTRALASVRRFVELPVLFRAPDGCLVEGKIDLLFEERDGWVVVDWKTDRLDEGEDLARREARHAPQLAAYRDALVAVLGGAATVKEARPVFARSPLPPSGREGQMDSTPPNRPRQLAFDFEA